MRETPLRDVIPRLHCAMKNAETPSRNQILMLPPVNGNGLVRRVLFQGVVLAARSGCHGMSITVYALMTISTSADLEREAKRISTTQIHQWLEPVLADHGAELHGRCGRYEQP